MLRIGVLVFRYEAINVVRGGLCTDSGLVRSGSIAVVDDPDATAGCSQQLALSVQLLPHTVVGDLLRTYIHTYIHIYCY